MSTEPFQDAVKYAELTKASIDLARQRAELDTKIRNLDIKRGQYANELTKLLGMNRQRLSFLVDKDTLVVAQWGEGASNVFLEPVIRE